MGVSSTQSFEVMRSGSLTCFGPNDLWQMEQCDTSWSSLSWMRLMGAVKFNIFPGFFFYFQNPFDEMVDGIFRAIYRDCISVHQRAQWRTSTHTIHVGSYLIYTSVCCSVCWYIFSQSGLRNQHKWNRQFNADNEFQ